jgi:hypothetical protein
MSGKSSEAAELGGAAERVGDPVGGGSGSGQGQAEDLKEVAEVRDRVVGSAIPVSLLSLIGIEHDSRQAGLPRSVDVAVHVIADVQRVLGRHGHTVERELEEPRVGFAVSVVAGNDDRVEVAEQAKLVQLAAGG